MKIILITLDTLRADRLGCHGYHLPTSPYIDQIANEGILFENAFAADIPTEKTHIIYHRESRFIDRILHMGLYSYLPKELKWLPSMLRKKGFTTATVDNLYHLQEWFARGFRYYINSTGENRWIEDELLMI